MNATQFFSNQMPKDIHLEIFQYLSPKDLKTSTYVNKFFQTLSEQQMGINRPFNALTVWEKMNSVLEKPTELKKNRKPNEITKWCEENKKNLSKVAIFQVYLTKITSVPKEIGFLSNVHTLYLNGNKIIFIDPEIWNLKNLKHLDLKDNQIEYLPPSISNLTNLKILNICLNKLKKVPDEIEKLSKLIKLDLGINELKTLPSGITKLTNLQTLEIDENDDLVLPIDIEHFLLQIDMNNAEGGFDDFSNYYSTCRLVSPER